MVVFIINLKKFKCLFSSLDLYCQGKIKWFHRHLSICLSNCQPICLPICCCAIFLRIHSSDFSDFLLYAIILKLLVKTDQKWPKKVVHLIFNENCYLISLKIVKNERLYFYLFFNLNAISGNILVL